MTDTSPIEYRKKQREVTKSRIDTMTDSELESLIENNKPDEFSAYVRSQLRKRKEKEKVFTTTQAYIITISTGIMALCAFLALIFQITKEIN